MAVLTLSRRYDSGISEYSSELPIRTASSSNVYSPQSVLSSVRSATGSRANSVSPMYLGQSKSPASASEHAPFRAPSRGRMEATAAISTIQPPATSQKISYTATPPPPPPSGFTGTSSTLHHSGMSYTSDYLLENSPMSDNNLYNPINNPGATTTGAVAVGTPLSVVGTSNLRMNNYGGFIMSTNVPVLLGWQ